MGWGIGHDVNQNIIFRFRPRVPHTWIGNAVRPAGGMWQKTRVGRPRSDRCSSPRSGSRNFRATSLILSSFFVPFVFFVAKNPLIFRARKFFPIVGKWVKKFSNHWKNIFQSLENLGAGGELADCAKPGGIRDAVFAVAGGRGRVKRGAVGGSGCNLRRGGG